jgi:signal transduction histidine kinase
MAKTGDARGSIASALRPRSVKRTTPGAEATTAAGLEFANELLGRDTVSPEVARQALDRMRRQAGAREAAFWISNGSTAKCAVRAGGHDETGASMAPDHQLTIIEPLRRQGAFVGRAGELPGLEQLIPHGARSLAALIVPSGDHVTGVLIVGWDAFEPPCDQQALSHLRLAAAVLMRMLTMSHDSRVTLADAILGSLAERVAVIDREGTILALNAAWTSFPLPLKTFESVQPGVNYFEICRRAVADGQSEFTAIVDGVTAVAQRRSPLFHSTFASVHSVGGESFMLTATPLHHTAGGAVLTHRNAIPEEIGDLAQRIGEAHFLAVADAIPIPVWIHDASGCVLHGNERWRHMAARLPRVAGGARWLDVVHPDDRQPAAAAFDEAFANRQTVLRELRIGAADGTYRASVCSGSPFTGVDGRLDAYICCCFDVGAPRNTESAVTDMSSKLMAAQEEERSRIGRELHDDLGQQTALLAAKIETLLQTKRTSSHSLRAGIEEAKGRVQDLAVSIHNLSHELHPPKLKLLGLVKTLQALCRDVAKESGLEVTFQAADIPPDIAERIALCICRVAQEGLRNAVKHSGARVIEVGLNTAASDLTLRITDNGRGFDPLSATSAGIGLLTMRERVESIGGRLLIDTSSAGTAIAATLPIAADAGAGHQMRSPFNGPS